MSVKRTLGRNMAWNTAGLTVETVTGFLVMPFLILQLGVSVYGVWIVLGAIITYFSLLDCGARGSIGRYVAFYHSGKNFAAVNQTLTGGLFILLLVGVTTVAAGQGFGHLFFRFFQVGAGEQAMVALVLQIVTVNFAVLVLSSGFDAALWGFQRFSWLNAVDITATVVKTVLTFALVRGESGLLTLAWVNLGVTIGACLAKVLLSFRADPQLRIGYRYLTRSSLREIIGFGSWNLIGSVAKITRRQLVPVLIGSKLGLESVAPFYVVDRLLVTVSTVMSAITGVLTPHLTALHATAQRERERKLFLLGSLHSAALAVFLIAFLVVLGNPLLALWVGPVAGGVPLLLGLLALGDVIPNTQFVTNCILQATARHQALAVFAVLEAIGVVVLAVLLIPVLGLIGAGLSIAIPALLFRGIATMIHGCRVMGVLVGNYVAKAILPAVLCVAGPAVVVGLAAVSHPPRSWLQFVAFGIAYTALFAACYGAIILRFRSPLRGIPKIGASI